jgi:hypothetical protein
MVAFIILPRMRIAPDVNQASDDDECSSTLQVPSLTVQAGILIQAFFA